MSRHEDGDAEVFRLLDEMSRRMKVTLDGLLLTAIEKQAAEEMAIDLMNHSRDLRRSLSDRGINTSSLTDAATLALAFIQVDYRERFNRPDPPPGRE